MTPTYLDASRGGSWVNCRHACPYKAPRQPLYDFNETYNILLNMGGASNQISTLLSEAFINSKMSSLAFLCKKVIVL